ncbi:MAG: DUF1186 domain-containing protein [Lentimicrobium sp.]|nr:DUF1186 domain-containing protein [Lentimicrobium sp.]
MNDQFDFHGYRISTDHLFTHNRLGIGRVLIKELEDAAMQCQDPKNKYIIGRLLRLIDKYPDIPMFKNYLSFAYSAQGEYKKAMEVNDTLFKEHPGYLFARINKANSYIDKKEVEKVPEMLGPDLDLRRLYPERDVFHFGELSSYLNVVIRYYAVIGDLEMAEEKLDLLQELAPEEPITEQAESYLHILRMERAFSRMQEAQKMRIEPTVIKKIKRTTRKTPPAFHHDEINNLYHFGMRIPRAILEEILALPRPSLIADLEAVLQDAVDRYGYFEKLDNQDETHSSPLHAMFLLAALKATESLPRLLEFLEADKDFLEFWLGDHQTSTLWQVVYALGLNKIDELRRFLLKPGINTYSKTIASDALCQILLHNPERRPEILGLYSDVFQTFARSSVDENLVDNDLLGLMICDAIDCRLPELIPLVKTLYDKQYVTPDICGSYEEVEKAFQTVPKYDKTKKVNSLFDLYENILTTWAGYREDKRTSSFYEPEPNHPAFSVKIGRNDPCPCGSGKKYKKCCMP